MQLEMNIKPTVKQGEAWLKLFDKETRFILFGGGVSSGKSWLTCEWIVYMCLKYPGTKYFIAREELKRIMGSTYLTLLKVFEQHKIPQDVWDLNGQYNYIQFTNGSRIDLLDVKLLPSDPLFQRFGSLEYTSGALEEVGEIDFGAFEVLKTRIGRQKNKEYNIPPKILMTCNPSKNWTYYEFYKPWKEGKLSKDIAFIQALYTDNPHIPASYIESLKSISSELTKQRLMLGNWEYDDDPTKLFNYESIVDLFTNGAERGLSYCSIDVAGRGRDKTVIVIWDGLYITEIILKDNITSIDLDKLLIKNNIPRSRCVVDEDGVGFGLVNDLKVKGFVNGSSPIKKKIERESDKVQRNYKNLKSQCWFELANLVNNGKIGIYREVNSEIKKLLIEDLEQIKQENVDKDTPLSVISKEDIKKILGRSSDTGDAVMMRMFFELQETRGGYFFA